MYRLACTQKPTCPLLLVRHRHVESKGVSGLIHVGCWNIEHLALACLADYDFSVHSGLMKVSKFYASIAQLTVPRSRALSPASGLRTSCGRSTTVRALRTVQRRAPWVFGSWSYDSCRGCGTARSCQDGLDLTSLAAPALEAGAPCAALST